MALIPAPSRARRRQGSWVRAAVVIVTLQALVGVIAACGAQRAAVEPSGRIEILGPRAGFDPAHLAADWSSVGGADERLRVVALGGVPSLRFEPGRRPVTLARRTDAVLLATPFLSWAWNLESAGSAPHPVRLVVGFDGGDPDGRSWGDRALVWFGTALPPHDRLLVLRWGASALERGALDTGAGSQAAAAPRVATYTVRGGPENAATWWLETVDLADLYARAWPGDRSGSARVVFVGFAADPGPAGGHLSGVLLSR